jgi:hypothetical protein
MPLRVVLVRVRLALVSPGVIKRCVLTLSLYLMGWLASSPCERRSCAGVLR